MIISFAGNAGAGKSTIAAKLAEKLGWPRYYMGGLRRNRAKELGLTLEEYNRLGETDPQTDLEVDRYQAELGKNDDNFIIEGRTSWHFIPHSFKIFLDVEEKIGAQRIMEELLSANDRNETTEKIENLEKMIEKTRQRKESDIFRYQKYFGIDAYEKNNFDLVLDTSNLTIEESLETIHLAILEKIGKS
jgi:cytidylate kinase